MSHSTPTRPAYHSHMNTDTDMFYASNWFVLFLCSNMFSNCWWGNHFWLLYRCLVRTKTPIGCQRCPHTPFFHTWGLSQHWEWPTFGMFCECARVCGWRSFPVTSMFFTCWMRWWSVPCALLAVCSMTASNRADKHRRSTTRLASALTVTELASNRLWQGAMSIHLPHTRTHSHRSAHTCISRFTQKHKGKSYRTQKSSNFLFITMDKHWFKYEARFAWTVLMFGKLTFCFSYIFLHILYTNSTCPTAL